MPLASSTRLNSRQSSFEPRKTTAGRAGSAFRPISEDGSVNLRSAESSAPSLWGRRTHNSTGDHRFHLTRISSATHALQYRLRIATFADAAIAQITPDEIEPCERHR